MARKGTPRSSAKVQSGAVASTGGALPSSDVESTALLSGAAVEPVLVMETQRFQAAILDALPAHVAVLDQLGRITAVNSAWTDFARRNGGEIERLTTGVNYLEICRGAGSSDPVALDALRGIESILTGAAQRFVLQYPCHSATEQRWFLMTVTRPAVGIGGAIVTHTDISEQKRSELALREKEELFHKAFRSSPVALVISRLQDGVIMDVNSAFCRLSGYEPHELIGGRGLEIGLVTAEERDAYLELLGQRGGFRDREMVLGAKEGQKRLVLASAECTEVGGQMCVLWTGYDITERRRAEEQARSVALFPEENPTPVLRAGLDGTLLYANRASGGLLAQWQCTVGSRLPAQVREAARRALELGAPQELDLGIGERFFSFVLMPIPERQYVNFYGRDVTERNQVVRALRQSEENHRLARERYELVLAGSGAGIWDWDVCGRKVLYSRRWKAMRGLAEHEVSDSLEEWSRAIHPEDVPRVMAAVEDHFSGKTDCFDEEYRVRCKDGSWIWVSDRGIASRDDSGRVIRMAGSETDITKRKRAEAALREIEERLRTVLHATGVGLWLNELPLNRLNWDARTRELFFLQPDQEPTADLFWSRLHPDDREPTRREVEAALREDRIYAMDHRAVDPATGRIRWIHSEGRGLRDTRGNLVRFDGVNYDITHQKEFQAELERQVAERTAKLQELVGELEHFSYTITHDMRAPLRAMRGFGQAVSDMCEEWHNEKARDFLGRIMSSADRMDALIRDALNYSRAVRQELPLDDVDTGALLRGMLDTYPELQSSRANIQIQGTLPVVLGNEAGLTQCFSNLLGNAVKFTKPGELPLICVWSEQCGGWVRIWVEDNGVGISPPMLPHVFDMFSRAARKHGGTGIGLALVRKVAQRMGGKVGVQSEEGRGSRFWLELKTGRIRPDSPPQPNAQRRTGPPTVLYVENQETNAACMKTAFAGKRLAGCLRIVADGRAAIEYLSGSGHYSDRDANPIPKLVLLNLNLPHVHGFEVLTWMRNHPDFADTPVVVLAETGGAEDRTRAQALGAADFLLKPDAGMNFSEVLEVVLRNLRL